MEKTSIFLIAAMTVGLIACSGGGKNNDATSANSVENSFNEDWVTPNDVETGIGKKSQEKNIGVLEFIKLLDAKKVTTSNKNVLLYSLPNSKTCLTIPVVFKQDEPITNMSDFIAVANEVSEKLFMKPKLKDKLMGIFLGFTSDGESVCGLSMYPQEQVFSLRGFDFMTEKADLYRDAFDALVKEKSRKSEITEWDYFIFRSMVNPEQRKMGEMCDQALICVAGATMIELLKFTTRSFEEALLSNKQMAEKIFSAITEKKDSQQIMGLGFSVNTIWFNSRGNRIMAELARKLPSGEIKKERKWYNGYSEPK
ncbi:MAG: hypothetical protein LBD53_09670 [Tannerella sp.]|jgi:hypothetical protein|nr:hypothetical protein [Tannerella sp.]